MEGRGLKGGGVREVDVVVTTVEDIGKVVVIVGEMVETGGKDVETEEVGCKTRSSKEGTVEIGSDIIKPERKSIYKN